MATPILPRDEANDLAMDLRRLAVVLKLALMGIEYERTELGERVGDGLVLAGDLAGDFFHDYIEGLATRAERVPAAGSAWAA